MQKTFTFTKSFSKEIPKKYTPMGYFTAEDEFIFQLNKSGYLVNEVRRAEVLVAYCAKANIPKKDRLEMQKQIKK